MASIDEFLQQAGITTAQTKSAGIELAAASQQLQDSEKETAARYQSLAESAELIARVSGGFKLQAEDAKNVAALQLASDPLDLSGKQSADAQRLLELQEKRRAAADRVSQKDSVGFFDSPVEWFVNQFTINDDIRAYNDANSKAGEVEATMMERANALSLRVQNINAAARTTSAAMIEANAQTAKQLALLQADEATRRGIGFAISGIKDVLGASLNTLKTYADVVNVKTQQEQLQIAYDNLAMHRESMDMAIEAQKAKEGGHKFVVDAITRGLNIINPALRPPDANDPDILRMISGAAPLNPLYKKAFERGVLSNYVDPDLKGARPMAETPAAFAEFMQFKPFVAPEQKRAITLYNDTLAEIKDTLEFKNAVTTKNFAAQEEIVNKTMRAKFSDAFSTAVKGDDSVAQVLPLPELLKLKPELAQLPIIQKSLGALLVSKPEALKTASDVYTTALADFQASKMTSEEFTSGITTLFRTAQRLNIQAQQIPGMGIVVPESYKVKIPSGGLIDPVIDLTDKSALIRDTAKFLSARAVRYETGYRSYLGTKQDLVPPTK